MCTAKNKSDKNSLQEKEHEDIKLNDDPGSGKEKDDIKEGVDTATPVGIVVVSTSQASAGRSSSAPNRNKTGVIAEEQVRPNSGEKTQGEKKKDKEKKERKKKRKKAEPKEAFVADIDRDLKEGKSNDKSVNDEKDQTKDKMRQKVKEENAPSSKDNPPSDKRDISDVKRNNQAATDVFDPAWDDILGPSEEDAETKAKIAQLEKKVDKNLGDILGKNNKPKLKKNMSEAEIDAMLNNL